MKKATEHFNFVYRGELVNNHTFSTHELGVALLSLDDIFTAANNLVGKEKATVSTKVKALKGGSFDIQMIIEATNIIDFFNSDTYNAIQEIVALLFGTGILGSGGVVGIIKLIRYLKGRKITQGQELDIPKEEGGTKKYIPSDREVEAINHDILRKGLEGVLSPAGQEGMEGLSIVGSNVHEWIAKEDVPSYIWSQSKRPLNTITASETFRILSPTFKEGNKWKLQNTQSNLIINALLKDEAFIKKIDNHQVSFSKNDLLECDIEIIQYEKNNDIVNEYYIIRVIKHHP